jgi:mannosyltransferase OCH1-like enzyme
MIPKLLWQTYKDQYPPKISAKFINSWFQLNPEIEWFYMDDIKCDNFIKDNFNEDFYKMYKNVPLGVMRSDIWRVCIIYVYGGIYADLDTLCLKSIDNWIKPNNRMVVGVETQEGTINNYTFAAEPKHPGLYSIIETFLKLYKENNYVKSQLPVQSFGAHAFCYGLLKYYNLYDDKSLKLGAKYYNSVKKVNDDGVVFLPYENHVLSWNVIESTCVQHVNASQTWIDNYVSWRNEQKNIFGV